jgi:hypothetical protein
MKKVLILALGVVLAANVAMADHVGVYADPAGTSCTLVAPVGVPFGVYAVHKFTAGATASRFKIVDTSGGFQLGQASPYAVLGNAYTGVSIGYGTCLTGAISAMTLNYFGVSAVCGKLEVVADPIRPYVEVTDCNFADKQGTGGTFYFNPNGTCTNCNEVATEATTWGTIKALYR